MSPIVIRPASSDDIEPLFALENNAFRGDRLSRRRLQHWLKAANGILLVCESSDQVVGYGLVILHKGTRLARLYSLAVSAEARGLGVGKKILSALEQASSKQGRLFMRLEVAKNNHVAIKLYESMGYRVFDEYTDYYEDHSDALRMQKRIRSADTAFYTKQTPWYQQTTEFTCGPASLMMAMASLQPSIKPDAMLELDIWREATTIFMTSGHGGCHPIGLALAARRRGFSAAACINTAAPLFIEGVRSEHKKEIMTLVDRQFHQHAQEEHVACLIQDITQEKIQGWLAANCAVLVLISTYRMDGKKAPHWVAVTAIDDDCLYVHDPDTDKDQIPMDCQYMPISREDFSKMSAYGSERIRTAVVISKDPLPDTL